MKTVTLEELLKDEFFQEKVREVKSDEEMTALLQSYRIIFSEDKVSAENGVPSEAAEQMADLLSKLGYETNAADMQEAINNAKPVDEGELDESALEEVAGGARLPMFLCRRVCVTIFKRRVCTYMCF